MKRSLLIVVALLLSSCTLHVDRRVYYVAEDTPIEAMKTSEELAEYVQAFEERTGEYGMHAPVYLAYIEDPTVVGRCLIHVSDSRITKNIEISIQWYDKHAEDTWLVRWVVFHELGHCSLGQDHRDEYLTSGEPASIMNSMLPDDGAAYEQGHQYYEYELLGY